MSMATDRYNQRTLTTTGNTIVNLLLIQFNMYAVGRKLKRSSHSDTWVGGDLTPSLKSNFRLQKLNDRTLLYLRAEDVRDRKNTRYGYNRQRRAGAWVAADKHHVDGILYISTKHRGRNHKAQHTGCSAPDALWTRGQLHQYHICCQWYGFQSRETDIRSTHERGHVAMCSVQIDFALRTGVQRSGLMKQYEIIDKKKSHWFHNYDWM